MDITTNDDDRELWRNRASTFDRVLIGPIAHPVEDTDREHLYLVFVDEDELAIFPDRLEGLTGSETGTGILHVQLVKEGTLSFIGTLRPQPIVSLFPSS